MNDKYLEAARLSYSYGNPFEAVVTAAVIAELQRVKDAADADAEHAVVMQDTSYEWNSSTWYDVVDDRINELKEEINE